MSILYNVRQSDSPYVETVTQGWTVSDGTTIRPAETHWHLVFTRVNGRVHPIMIGALTSAGQVSWGKDAEILWIKFKLGTFMPHLPVKQYRDSETLLPEGAGSSFWLNSSTWQFPDFENADTFVDRLVRGGILLHDPLVNSVLNDQAPAYSPRTLRHRFLQSTGMTQTQIRQAERAQQAATMLQQGSTILDTVYTLGYFDQPHLTRSLKQWIGYTPAQIAQGVTESTTASTPMELTA